MRKKIIGLILCLCLSGVVIGCGDAGSDKESAPASGSGAGSTTHSTPKSTSEPTPEPAKPSFTQVGTQIDGGEIAGLTWVFTDAGELLVTGEVTDASELEACRSYWGYELYSWNFPWYNYMQQVSRAYLAFSGDVDMSFWFCNPISVGRYSVECDSLYSGLLSVDMSDMDMSGVTNMEHMFAGCSGLLSVNLSSTSPSSVTDMSHMFEGCSSLSSVDFTGFDMSNVRRMWGMFSGCSALASLDLSNLDTSNVEDMRGMFDECDSLTSLNLSGFDTSSVEDMNGMFAGCSSLTSLDLSSFDTSNVRTMGYERLGEGADDVLVHYESAGMFSGCRNLRSLDLCNFNTRNVYNMDSMFYGCASLQEILVGDDWLLGESHEYMFYECGVDKVTYK